MKTVQSKQFQGFTLIELMIILAIAGILFSTAVPELAHLLARNQQTAQLHTLFKHHQLARSEAVKNNNRVLLCKSYDGQQCTSSGLWSDGWIIFSDTDNNKKMNDNERVIYIQSALSENLSLKYRGFGSHHYIQYYPDGHSSSNGTFTLCSQYGDKFAKSIIISRTGRARIASQASGGKALTCS